MRRPPRNGIPGFATSGGGGPEPPVPGRFDTLGGRIYSPAGGMLHSAIPGGAVMFVRRFSPVGSILVRASAWALILALFAPGGLARPRAASAESDIKVILTDSLYGAAAGALLGGVLMLVVDKDNRDDTLRWGIVLGTFSGFAYGIYETSGDSGGYSGLLRPIPPGSSAAPEQDELDPALAAWADSMQVAQAGRSPVLASLVGSVPFQGRATALGAQQRR